MTVRRGRDLVTPLLVALAAILILAFQVFLRIYRMDVLRTPSSPTAPLGAPTEKPADVVSVAAS